MARRSSSLKCRHAGCGRYSTSYSRTTREEWLARHLAYDHGYTNAQQLEAVFPGSAERGGYPRPELPPEWSD